MCEILHFSERRFFCVHRKANHKGFVVNKWYCDRFHSEYFGFILLIIIPY